MVSNQIVKGILGYSISTWTNLFIGLLYIIVSTRVLTPDVYGLITLFYTVATVLMYVLSLGLDSAYIRYFNTPPIDNTKQQMLYTCILISTIVCFCSALFSVFLIPSVYSNVFGFFSRLLIGVLFIYIYCQLILRYLNITFRMSFKTLNYNIQNIVMNGASKLIIVIAALIRNDFIFIIAMLTVIIALVLIIYLIYQQKDYIPINSRGDNKYHLNLKGYRSFFRFALFSSPTYVVTYSNLYLGQQIVASNLGAYALGIFASTSFFSQIIISIRNGFATYWTAFVYKNYKEERLVISKMHDYILSFSIIIVCLLALSRDFVYLFIGGNFHESKSFFSIMMIMPILGFVQETTDKGILLVKKNEIILAISFFAVLTNVIVSVFLIDKFGLIGAAIGNASSALFTYIFSTFWGQKFYKTTSSSLKSLIGIIIIVTILIVPSVFVEMYNIVLIVISLFFLSIYFFIEEYSNMVKTIYTFIRRGRL